MKNSCEAETEVVPFLWLGALGASDFGFMYSMCFFNVLFLVDFWAHEQNRRLRRVQSCDKSFRIFAFA